MRRTVTEPGFRRNLHLHRAFWDDMPLLCRAFETSTDSGFIRRSLIDYEWVTLESLGLNEQKQKRRFTAHFNNGQLDLLDTVDQLRFLDKIFFEEPTFGRQIMLFNSTVERIDRVLSLTAASSRSDVVRQAIRFNGLTLGCVASKCSFFMREETGANTPLHLYGFQIPEPLYPAIMAHRRFIVSNWELGFGESG